MKRGQEALMQQTKEMRKGFASRSVKMCWRKKRYPTMRPAEEMADRVFAEEGVKLRVYWCPLCEGFHLTHKEEG